MGMQPARVQLNDPVGETRRGTGFLALSTCDSTYQCC